MLFTNLASLLKTLRKILWTELDKLKTEKVSSEELEKAKNQILRQMFASSSQTSLQRSLSRAELLAEYTSFYNEPGGLDKDLQAYMNVSAEDIQRVAKQIFTEEGSTVLDVIPTADKKPVASEKKSTNHG